MCDISIWFMFQSLCVPACIRTCTCLCMCIYVNDQRTAIYVKFRNWILNAIPQVEGGEVCERTSYGGESHKELSWWCNHSVVQASLSVIIWRKLGEENSEWLMWQSKVNLQKWNQVNYMAVVIPCTLPIFWVFKHQLLRGGFKGGMTPTWQLWYMMAIQLAPDTRLIQDMFSLAHPGLAPIFPVKPSNMMMQ